MPDPHGLPLDPTDPSADPFAPIDPRNQVLAEDAAGADEAMEDAADEAAEAEDERQLAVAREAAESPTAALRDLRICFVGKLGGMSRRDVHRIVRQQGGLPIERCELPLDWVVLGADELPLGDEDGLDETVRDAAASGQVEILTETQFWQRLGWGENEQHVRRLYTPAMLAQLLNVPVSVVRRWHRRGLIVPSREVHRLPYFDFQEVATARRLAELLSAGATPAAIERQLAQLAQLVPEVERPIAQLSVIVEGRGLLLRQGEGLVEPGGQMRFDFPEEAPPGSDAVADDPAATAATRPPAIPIRDWLAQRHEPLPTCEELVAAASELEDDGQVVDAIATYRLALAVGGPRPELCFRLAELLYMSGDVTAARERYSMAIEMDENYVEARANLACVLVETGQTELAIAAFQGALRSHPDYPDVHYHLANLLDRCGDETTARHHWERFLALASESPWADEARERLGMFDS